MALLGLDDATLVLGGKTLFQGVSLGLSEEDRIGLIGPNGSGKTSMLRLLAGELSLDGGRLDRRRNLRVGYLPQEIVLEGGRSLLQFVRATVPGRAELETQIKAREKAAERSNDDAQALDHVSKLVDLHGRLSHLEADYGDHMAMRILGGLGFTAEERDRDLGELSGGWCMRALLGALLFMQPDVLLMDEPTNHLDMPSVAWLSGFLSCYQRAFILISHDREFLNEQINRVWSFEPEGMRSYAGDYDRYAHTRAEERVLLKNRAANLQRERAKAEQFINRFRAQANKARAVQSRVKALDKMDQIEVHDDFDVARFTFPPTKRTAKEVLRVEGLSKAYGTNSVLEQVGLSATRGERIGVIGVNGAGKTTLLRILAGELQPDIGDITYGTHVDGGYYAQHHTDVLNPELTVLQSVAEIAGQSAPRVRTLLGSLLFRGDDVDKRVAVLSGGERARVALARLFLSPHNLLLMDEPTNHLDLHSSEQLADALSTFDGTLIFVSHNRAFMRRLATRIWNVSQGDVTTYPGTLDEYLASAQSGLDDQRPTGASRNRRDARARKRKETQQRDAEDRKRTEAQQHDARARRRKEARAQPLRDQLERLDADITRMQEEQKVRSNQLADRDFFAKPEAAEVLRAHRDTERRLDRLSERWKTTARKLAEFT